MSCGKRCRVDGPADDGDTCSICAQALGDDHVKTDCPSACRFHTSCLFVNLYENLLLFVSAV